jgi:hypothetical protein
MKKIAIIVALLGLNFAFVKCAPADPAPASTDAVAFAEEVALDKNVTQEVKNPAALPTPPAEEKLTSSQETKCLVGIEFLSGYGRGGNIRRKDDIQEIPFMLDIDLNLKPLLKKVNFNLPVLAQFQIEPFISSVYEPVKDNLEGGVAFWFKFGLLPETWKFQPYAKFGAGFDYMTLHTLNESTQFNFISQAAFGMHYFLTKNTALTVEGRYRHLSNAGIKEPNRGINSYFILGGIAYRY